MSAEINYRLTVASLLEDKATRYAPTTGIIDSAIIHFPAGCQSLVEVFINLGTEQILPAAVRGDTQGNIGIALDDTTQPFEINKPVEQGMPIEVLIKNHDGVNPHTISVIVKVSEVVE